MTSATLYSFPFSCSMAVEIVLRQHAVSFESVAVGRGPDRKAIGALAAVNRRRKVPTLVLDEGVFTEIVAVLAYLDARLVPERSPTERQRLLEWSSFVATEFHQQVLGPLFDKHTPQAAREDAVARLLPPVLADIEQALAESPSSFLLGDTPSGADAYLYWGALLVKFHDRRALGAATSHFCERMGALPFVREAVSAHRAATARPKTTQA